MTNDFKTCTVSGECKYGEGEDHCGVKVKKGMETRETET